MHGSLGDRWDRFAENAVSSGRYASASEVVREGLRRLEERDAKLKALRETLDASVTRGGRVTDGALDASLAATSAELAQQGAPNDAMMCGVLLQHGTR